MRLDRGDAGNLDVSLIGEAPQREAHDGDQAEAAPAESPEAAPEDADAAATEAESADEPESSSTASSPATGPVGPTVIDVLPMESQERGLRLGPRRGSTRRRGAEDEAALLRRAGSQHCRGDPPPTEDRATEASPAGPPTDVEALGLPSEPDAILRYLTHRYRGVGEKTAETLVSEVRGRSLQDAPGRSVGDRAGDSGEPSRAGGGSLECRLRAPDIGNEFGLWRRRR